jgi:hypothetical protein
MTFNKFHKMKKINIQQSTGHQVKLVTLTIG